MINVRPADCLCTANIANFLETMNVIKVKLCMMVVLIALYPVVPLLSDLDCISRSQQCQTVLTENFIFLSDEV